MGMLVDCGMFSMDSSNGQLKCNACGEQLITMYTVNEMAAFGSKNDIHRKALKERIQTTMMNHARVCPKKERYKDLLPRSRGFYGGTHC